MCLSFLFISCDDGDVVITTFNFDDETPSFNFCTVENGNSGTTVFFIESSTNEIMTYELNSVYDDRIAREETNRSVSDGSVTYKKYTSSVNANNLFCQAIAPTGFNVENQLSSNRGEAILFTQWEIDPNGDDDGDRLPNREEGIDPNLEYRTAESLENLLDTDGDGIPNFRDEDDDNDNVRTIDELARDNEGNLIEDEEGYGRVAYTLPENETAEIPDHLNDDDDADGVKTYNEITESINNPLNNIPKDGIDNPDNIPAFRLREVNESLENNVILNHDYQVNTRTFLIIQNLGLNNGETTVVQEEFNFGEKTNSYTDNDDLEGITRSDLEN